MNNRKYCKYCEAEECLDMAREYLNKLFNLTAHAKYNPLLCEAKRLQLLALIAHFVATEVAVHDTELNPKDIIKNTTCVLMPNEAVAKMEKAISDGGTVVFKMSSVE